MAGQNSAKEELRVERTPRNSAEKGILWHSDTPLGAGCRVFESPHSDHLDAEEPLDQAVLLLFVFRVYSRYYLPLITILL